MKRIVSFLIAAAFLLSACGSKETEKKSKKTKKENKKTENVEKVDDEDDSLEVDSLLDEVNTFNYDFSSAEIGDTITFGNYPQTEDGEVMPIEWEVLDIKDGKALVISKYALDTMSYSNGNEKVTWETCIVRSWLNNDFLNTAFTEREKEQIADTTVETEHNPFTLLSGGHDTVDKLFLLSIQEAKQYFDLTKNNGRLSDNVYYYGDACCCTPTEYAVSRGAYVYEWNADDKDKYRDCSGNCIWYLRSRGLSEYESAFISPYGYLTGASLREHPSDCSIRPAMWVYLNSEHKDDNESSSIEVGDTIILGTYPQDADGSVLPIKWIVLDVQDGKALVISKFGLDRKPYNVEPADVTWENCSLRAWLNSDFLSVAFSKEENDRILETNVINQDNPFFGTPGGNDTVDKVFLLSIDEVLQYFHLTKNAGEKESRILYYGDDCICYNTDYAVSLAKSYGAFCCWWLRSPGNVDRTAAIIDESDLGYCDNVDEDGQTEGVPSCTVRPAMWITI